MSRDRRYYCVYMMGSLSGTLYIGFSGNLQKRVFQHKFHHFEGFTDKYDVTRSLYWESYDDVHKGTGAGDAAQRLDSGEEDCAVRAQKSALAGPGCRLVPMDAW
jgi:predicted GIY-YIG superfamily endonuclease